MVPLIIVKFTRLCARDALYKVRSRLKNFTIEDIGLGSQGGNKIFIEESLIPARRELLHKCNEFKKKCKLRYIWSFYVRVMLAPHFKSVPRKVW